MNHQSSTLKLTALVLACSMMSSVTWAMEGKAKSAGSNAACNIENRDASFGMAGQEGKVEVFGDLSLRLVSSKGAAGSVVDIKGPHGFSRRNVELNTKVPVIFELCGKEVTVMDTGTAVRVSAF